MTVTIKSNALACVLAALAPLAGAETGEQPLWEVGAGVAAIRFPAYRGSEQSNGFILPMPYFVYRGQFLKADRHGLRGQLFDSDRLDFTVSGALSPPAGSDDIDIRAGMPNLRATFEVGPEVDVTLWRSENRARFMKLLLPLRSAHTLERSPRDIGWVFQPKLNLDIADLPGLGGWTLGMLAGPVYGDRRQHAYFYSVAPEFAGPGRPAYDARRGYAGMQYLAALSKRYPKYWIGGFVRYDSLAGAVFEDSPLVRRKSNFAAGIAFSWIFGESAARVPVNE